MKAPLPPNEAQRLETLRGYDVLDTPPESAFDDLTLLAAQICQVPIALISLVDENRQWFKSTIGVSATETSRDFAFCAHAILYSDEVLEVRDAQLDPRFADNPLVTADPHICFYAGAPLVAPDGLALGTLCVIDRVPRVLSAEQQIALRALSRTVIAQLELRRTLAAHRRAEEKLQSLNASLEQKVEARTGELRREMEARSESEQQYQTLADSGQALIWTADTDKLCNYFNEAWLDFTGRVLEQELGNGWADGVHPDDFQRCLDVYMSSFDRREKFSMDYRLRRYDGEYRWIQDDGCPRYNSKGEFIGYIGYCLDITERKKAEQATQEAKERMEIIFNTSPDAVLISRLSDGYITDVNNAFINFSGYTKEESIGNTTLGLNLWVNPDDRQKFIHELQTAGFCENFEAQFRKKDGSQHTGILSVGITTIQGISHIVSTTRDITERKRIEQKSEVLMRRHQALMKSALEGIHIMDMQGNIVESNDAFCRMLGYTQEEMANLNVADWDAQWSREELMERFKKLIRLDGALFETRHRRKDGNLIDVEVSTTGTEIDGDNYLYASSRDITERKRADEAMRLAAVTFETQEAILITDPEAKILRVNQAFQEITGYRAKEVIGQNPRMFQSGRHDAAFYQAMWSALLNTGKWSGEVWDRRKDGSIYPKLMTITAVHDDNQRVTHYVAVSRDISNRKQSEQEIHQLAFYDSLTMLPNRRLLQDRLQQALAVSARNGRHGALLFLDLDHFKIINDTQGHAMGDQLLIEVARRLQNCVREGDSVARLGGDEFVVVLEELSSETDEAATQTELVAEKIRSELGQPYLLKDYECLSTASIGISLFSGHQESAEDLLKHADVAMYQAKTAGRNAIRFFDPHMQMALEVRAALEADLRHALEKQQFRLYYQIQVDNLRRPLGAEVLLRWEHPERGLVSPLQFIPLAEETGLIVPIGLWVLQTACAQLKEWQNAALTRDLTLAVNVSAKQFRQADFVAQVQRVLLESGAQPSHLKLELTESIVLESIEEIINKMQELKLLGVNFSLDDFGTGYSSLQYLKRLPLDQIKIDRSFVRDIGTDPSDAAIVQTIIAMTETLRLNVIAEGVETEAQREFLELRGCHAFQGYLFSKPVPFDEFERLLKRS